MDNNNLYSAANTDGNPSPRYYAMGSMILGILSLSLMVFSWAGSSSWLGGLVFGIVGASLAGKASKAGYVGGMRTTGLVLSIIGIVLAGLGVMCIGCVGCLGCVALGEIAAAASMM